MPKRKQKPLKAKGEARDEDYSALSRDERALVKRQFAERRDKAIADRLFVQNQITTGELVERQRYAGLMGKIYAVDRSQFLETGASLSSLIAAHFSRHDGPDVVAAELAISDFCYEIMVKLKGDMEAWLKNLHEKGDRTTTAAPDASNTTRARENE